MVYLLDWLVTRKVEKTGIKLDFSGNKSSRLTFVSPTAPTTSLRPRKNTPATTYLTD